MRCLDGRSSGDVRQYAKIGSARFWVGIGTSQILVLIINAHLDGQNDCLHCKGFRVVIVTWSLAMKLSHTVVVA